MAERSTWIVERSEAVATGGMVACKTPQAADAAAAVLARGGNAIDAAVTCAFVAAVVEPWMNGIGGGGYLVAHIAATGEDVVIEYPMVSAKAARPEMFRLAGDGTDKALFGWPVVQGNENIVGHKAVAVPGTPAGLALALEKYGTISLAEAIAPAIVCASEGIPASWHWTLEVARDLANLNRFPATRAIFCDANGYAPWTVELAAPVMIRQADLARTLQTIADQGPRAFYEGAFAAAAVAHLQEGGAPFTLEDFRDYQATIATPIRSTYHGHEVTTIGKGTGGTTLSQGLRMLDGFDLAGLGHNSPEALHLMAEAFKIAFADRFAYLADPDHVEVPLDALLSADYIAERRAGIRRDAAQTPRAGDRARLGVRHNLAVSLPEYTKSGCTTHLSTIDAAGNAVSITQTQLSVWGSRVTIPSTGVLMNNGMMWFDPVPGKPNSVGGGQRPLSNMAPLILKKEGKVVAAIGSSGGRRIMNANAQILMNVADHGMTMQPAVSAPRIDASTVELLADVRLAPKTLETLSALGHTVVTRDDGEMHGEFASPACVGIAPDGTRRGGVDPYYYPATAAGVNRS